MRRPPAMGYPAARQSLHQATFPELLDALDASAAAPPPQPRGTKTARLQKALHRRMVARGEADVEQRRRLNAEIRCIRRKLDVLAPLRKSPNLAAPYQPPLLENPEDFTSFLRKKYASDVPQPPVLLPRNANPIAISPDDIREAAKAVRPTARTSDFSPKFLLKMEDEAIAATSVELSRWVREGVPERQRVAWVFLFWKGKMLRASDPRGYRPIAIMPLFAKLLHTAVYLKMRPLVLEYVKRCGFQYGCGQRSGAAQVALFAKEWLESDVASNEDDEHLLLLVDVMAAFDSIPHGRLIETVGRRLGPEWAITIARVIENQAVTIAHHEGFTAPVALNRGVLQGSPLSVLLFIVYTCEPPAEADARMYVDDLVARTTRARLPYTFGRVQNWANSKGLELEEKKVVVVAKSSFEWSSNPVRETVDKAVLLGVCIHAKRHAGGCENGAKKLERVARLVDYTNSHLYRSTRRRCAFYTTHVLPTLSMHSLSTCFDPRAPKLTAAQSSLLPKHRYSRGIKEFAGCKDGYACQTVESYASMQQTRAYLAFKRDGVGDDLPTKGFRRRAPRETAEGASLLAQTVKLVNSQCRGTRNTVVASDGGFVEEEARGSVGVSIGAKKIGAVLRGTVTSSTDAELAAMLLLATALRICGVLANQLVWYCDSQAAIQRVQRRRIGDPVAECLGEYAECLRWSKGHAENQHINRADEAASITLREGTPALDVEHLHWRNGEKAVCCFAAGNFPQLEGPAEYVRRVCQYGRAKTATRAIRQMATGKTTRGSTLRALETVPGAVDLLLAIVRRSILPKGTRVQCRRCCELATAEHVLLADDDTHNEVSDIRSATTRRPPVVKELLEDFALKHGPAVLHVARRVKALCDDPLAARWSTLITTYSV
ncbi:hypothetical protein DIPPA_32926 [Diplonema papillatum]|nr:hypothetical protein DIPPA_32926 [Diplonema papillatum]